MMPELVAEPSWIMKVRILSLIFTCVHFQGTVSDASHGNDTASYGGRILHGIEAIPQNFPFTVRLEFSGSLCGGSIISSHYILTAAHCMHGKVCISVAIFPSTWAAGAQSEFHAVECVPHSFYRNPAFSNDIGLVKTAEDLVKDGGLQVIALPHQNDEYPPGTHATIAGWGLTEAHALPPHLRSVGAAVIDWRDCDFAYTHSETTAIEKIPWDALCVLGHFPLPGSACFGDSGGPIVVNGVLAGVIIAAIHDEQGRCITGTPTLGLSVVEFLFWINKNTHSDRLAVWQPGTCSSRCGIPPSE